MCKKSDVIKALLDEIKSNVYSLEEADLEPFNRCPTDLFEVLVKKLDMAGILISEIDETEF